MKKIPKRLHNHHDTAFIAEISSNHNGNIERCIKFLDVCYEIGCAGVKFQLFNINELFSPQILEKSSKHRSRKRWELPLKFIPILSDECKNRGLLFGCTPFYLKGVQELRPYVDFLKISSYEILWKDLLVECGKTGKTIILSTGMSNLTEIKNAMRTLRKNGNNDISLLHCVSAYPTHESECNLKAIDTLRKEFKCNVGWSDHSVNPTVVKRAVNKWSAQIIEFHLDLDGKGEEYSMGHCWLPNEIGAVIKEVNNTLPCEGNGVKQPTPQEISDRNWRADPTDGLRPLKCIRNTWEQQNA